LTEKTRLKPGKHYQQNKLKVIKCICGVYLSGIDADAWIIEKKKKASPRAKSKWSLDYLEQDQQYSMELITKETWNEF